MAARRPRVFLHVGSPKTGTTFLQDVLWSQRETAVRQNARFVKRGYRIHGDLEELVPVTPDGPWIDPDAVAPELEASAAVSAICELLVDRAEPDPVVEPEPGLVPTARRVGGRLRRRLARAQAGDAP